MSILLVTLTLRISRTMTDTEKMFERWMDGWMETWMGEKKKLERQKIYLNLDVKKKKNLSVLGYCLPSAFDYNTFSQKQPWFLCV